MVESEAQIRTFLVRRSGERSSSHVGTAESNHKKRPTPFLGLAEFKGSREVARSLSDVDTYKPRSSMTTTPLACYVGWHGQGNIGDDAIREAVEIGLDGVCLIDLPLYPRAIAADMIRG